MAGELTKVSAPSVDGVSPSLPVIGGYQVQALVGEGGMGRVYRAFDPVLHRVVAIKMMTESLAGSGPARQRFLREARAAAAVVHEHVVVIHAVDEAGETPYLVMQYVKGQSLQDRIDKNGALLATDILRIGLQAAQGLAAAHAQGLVHRDVKPANILLENGIERVKLTDFGLARAVDDASLSQSGVIAGTPMYMSPEQANGDTVDHRSDLFSLGSVLYAMATGRAPFRASTTMGVLKRVCHDDPRPVRELNADVPEWLAKVIARLMTKDVSQRYQSATDVVKVLSKGLAKARHKPKKSGHKDSSALPATVAVTPRKRGRKWLAIGIGLLMLGIGLGIGWQMGLFAPNNQTPTQPLPDDRARPFAVLAGDARPESLHPTLTDALTAAQAGDTIEIRSNGPFETPPIFIRQQALTIRAGSGFRPVLTLNNSGIAADEPLIFTNYSLVLEGLELRRNCDVGPKLYRKIIRASGSLHVANCRFVNIGPQASGARTIEMYGGDLKVWNCEFLDNARYVTAIALQSQPGYRSSIRNNVFSSGGVELCFFNAGGTATLEQNTFLFTHPLSFCLFHMPKPEEFNGKTKPATVTVRSSIFRRRAVFCYYKTAASSEEQGKEWTGAEVATLLTRLLDWSETGNLHQTPHVDPFLGLLNPNSVTVTPAGSYKTLADWKTFWGPSVADVSEGEVRFQGGDLFATQKQDVRLLRPSDFRLAKGSPGQGVRPGGKDVGPDVDLVGPGTAYEAWQKTPEYAEWQKHTRELMEAR